MMFYRIYRYVILFPPQVHSLVVTVTDVVQNGAHALCIIDSALEGMKGAIGEGFVLNSQLFIPLNRTLEVRCIVLGT